MYLIDYHSHSELSPDSSAPLLENAHAAVAAGLSELCVTDHFDLLGEYGARQTPTHLNWAARVEQYHRVQAALAGKLTLKLGMEFGSGQVDAQDAAEVLQHPELDFVLGSIHNQTVAAGGVDFYCVDFTAPEQCHEMLDDYFTSLLRLVEADCYDVLGHVIYLPRYMCSRDGQKVDIYTHMEQLRSVLKGAAAHGKGIELNTWCGRTLEEWRPTLEAWRELGGEFITVGSDAHDPSDIGKGVNEAYTMLQGLGFRYVTTYEKRKPVPVLIDTK